MISDSDQRKMAKDVRVVANGARLPGWIFFAVAGALIAIFLFVSAVRFCEVYWHLLTKHF
jgi:hypothetical protein